MAIEAPIVFHMSLKTAVLPVKCTPARSRCESSAFEIIAGVAGDEVDDARRQARPPRAAA